MARIWTHGVWTVKPGRESDFIAAWREIVPLGTRLGSGDPKLLRERERPNVFRSFGPWPDVEAIGRFRAELEPHIAEMDSLLESFETFTLDEVYPGG
ncbi:MAG TPA: hypothetical protein VE693_13215 [Gaiellaceae bacterium]|jgi:hypothetical protein|nr:hypothetical protein [Gaiellaceae bacterium]